MFDAERHLLVHSSLLGCRVRQYYFFSMHDVHNVQINVMHAKSGQKSHCTMHILYPTIISQNINIISSMHVIRLSKVQCFYRKVEQNCKIAVLYFLSFGLYYYSHTMHIVNLSNCLYA